MMLGREKLEKQVRTNCEGPDHCSTVLVVMETNSQSVPAAITNYHRLVA